MMPPGGGGLHQYLNDLNNDPSGSTSNSLEAVVAVATSGGVVPLGNGPLGVPPPPGALESTLTPLHSSLNNNNNMVVSAGPSPSSSISPLHSEALPGVNNPGVGPPQGPNDFIPHTSVALAAAAAAAVSSMASMEAMGFAAAQHQAAHDQGPLHPGLIGPPPYPHQVKLEKGGPGASGDGSPKYISL